MGEHAGVRRAPCSWAVGKMAPCRAGAAGATEDRGGVDAGAHARHMRRRTAGLRQLTLPPRSISRLSSASLPSFAACHTALPIESLIASAALYRPSPARTPAHSGGHARLRGDAREAAARTPSRCACAARPQAPRSSGGGGGSRVARGRVEDARSDHTGRCRNAWLPRPRAARYGRAKQLKLPRPERVRCRPSGSTRALGVRVGSDPRSVRGQRPHLSSSATPRAG